MHGSLEMRFSSPLVFCDLEHAYIFMIRLQTANIISIVIKNLPVLIPNTFIVLGA
jgi:hypothetical protein